MNKVFKVIWNCRLGMFVVASELARSGHTVRVDNKKYRNVLFFALAILAVISSQSSANASNLQVYNFSPQDLFDEVVVEPSFLTGSFAGIARGMAGFSTMTLGQAKQDGLITGNSALLVDKNLIRMGSQTKAISYIDSITGTLVTMNVYNNNDIQTEAISDFRVSVSQPVGKYGQYVDRNLYQIGAGASLDVNVGQNSAGWVNSADNQFNIIMKSSAYNRIQSSAFKITDGGVINYNSKTVVQLGDNNNNIKDASNALAWVTVADFIGEFDSAIGEQNVTSVDEFKAYNDALIQAIQNGTIKLTEEQYVNELNKARDTTQHGIFADMNSIASDDAVRAFVNRDAVSFINGVGSGSNVVIGSDANIQLVASDATLVNLEDGSTLINNGTLGSAGTTYRGAYVIAARNTSFVENNGVIEAGTNPEMVDYFQSGASGVAYGIQTAIMANAFSVVNNNNSGVINVAARGDYYGNTGVIMYDNAVLNNYGAINIAASNEASSVLGNETNIGVIAQQNTRFDNWGTLYIGRQAQRTPDDSSIDLAIKQPSTGVRLNGNGTFNGYDTSQIIIGSQVQNATAIDVSENATLNHKGTININGAVAGNSVSSNVGIIARSGTQAANVVHDGVINLNGLNSTGIRVVKDGQITSSGIINVNGGMDPVTHFANYGIYAEGENALAILSGAVNLSGDYAIGVHARDKAEIDVTGNGTVNFTDGINQTGYYIYGEGSTINKTASGIQDVSTLNSTLYRVDGGASFQGPVDSSPQLNASGENATIIRTTGSGSSFDSGKLSLTVTGLGATGIRIEGGAKGEITSDAVISIAGKDASAGIVDGNYYNLDGSVNDSLNGNSVLTSYAAIDTANTADGAFGYIVRNNGRFIHEGAVNLTNDNSTGILVDGGILENNSDITVNGVAVNIQGENSLVINSGVVTATDGKAAYLVGNNATLALNGYGENRAAGTAHGILLDTGAKGLTVDGATISMDSTGSGNAIENKAGIDGIQLSNTIINVGNGVGVHTGASLAQTNSGIININGSGTGILFENVVDGSDTDQMFDMSGSEDLFINVNAAQGNGIITRASGDLKSGASVNVLNSDGNSALVVRGTTNNVEQSGRLTSASDHAAVLDLNNGFLANFTNKGDILAKDASHTALEMNSGNGITFTNATGANIVGLINLLSGDNNVILESGSTATDISSGSGEDNFILKDISEAESSSLFTSLKGGEGQDTLTLDNSALNVNISGTISGMEYISLGNNSQFTLNNISLGLGDDGLDGDETGYIIDSSSQLNIQTSGDTGFKSHLSGSGVVAIDTGKNNFSFDENNARDAFAGTVAFTNSLFKLAGVNSQALSNAILNAGVGSIVDVGGEEHNIGGLMFNNGTVLFANVTPGNASASGTITASSLDLSGRGTIQVDSGTVSNDRPSVDSSRSILEQDDMPGMIKLVTSDTAVKGGAGNLILQDKDGNVISDETTVNITQGGTVVAQGTYDYRLTGGDSDDGLYINYGLTKIELTGKDANALILDANGKSGNAADLSAAVFGSGDLTIDTGHGNTVSLSNLDNSYTGTTEVSSGILRMENDNVLGNTASLQLAAGTAFDMNGHKQTIGTLESAGDASLNVNNGELTIAQGGTSGGALAGAGALTLGVGTLTILGDNPDLLAKTTINADATAVLNSAAGLGIGDIINAGILDLRAVSGELVNTMSDSGSLIVQDNSHVRLSGNNTQFSGNIDVRDSSWLSVSRAEQLGSAAVSLNGTLAVDTASDWQLLNTLSGTGGLEKRGSGVVTLTSAAAYTGLTDITAGGLVLGTVDEPVALQSEQVNIANSAWLAGVGGTAGSIDNAGSLFVGIPEPATALMSRAAILPAGSAFTVGGDLNNSGSVYVGRAGETAGNELTVNGNYAGENGALFFNTSLGDDKSLTDHLTINGDTSGTTRVSVLNAGGTGAQTLNGIELIRVNGTSAGEFTQEGRIVAGAYDYSLVRGNVQNSGNWYLTSSTAAEPEKPVDPEKPVNPVEDNRRPEAGSYIANLSAANNMFITRLHDRMGGTSYIDAQGEYQVSSLWMRQEGGHNRARDTSGQLSTQSNRYVMQLGGDLAHWRDADTGSLRLGVMAGYGSSKSRTVSSATGYTSRGAVDGYTAGIYGTWFADENEKKGLYVDSWTQYSWFNNSVKGQGIEGENYKSKGVTASVESGYTFEMGTNEAKTKTFYLQPKAQVTWMGVNADDHRENNGTQVRGKGNNIQTRLGTRASLEGQNNKQLTFQLFTEANWIHNTDDYGVTMNGAEVKQAGAKNIAELKVGVEGNLSKNVNIWGNVGQQVGDKGYSDTGVMLGLKYSF